MKIEITGDPGTGNTFQEYNIQHIDNFNPNATTVNNTYINGVKQTPQESTCQNVPEKDTAPIKAEILNYVSKLKPYLTDVWKSKYDKLWNNILRIPAVDKEVYKPGKQQGTNFNRNLVAHIIYYIGQQGVFTDKTATHIAEKLEGNSEHPVRGALRIAPDEKIQSEVKRLLKEAEY